MNEQMNAATKPGGELAMPEAGRTPVTVWLFLFLIAAWPALIADKGFNLTDSGYYLSNYKFVFDYPANISFFTLLSDMFGHLFFLLPYGQLLAMNIFCVAGYAVVTFLAYGILKNHFPKPLILVGLFIASVYATFVIYTTSYNTMSYFMLMWAIWLLYTGLMKDRFKLVMASAVIIGLNIFVRLPNILQCTLAIMPLWYHGFCLGRWKKGLQQTAVFILLIFASLLAFCGIVILVTDYDYFLKAITFTFGILGGVETSGNHSSWMFIFAFHDMLSNGLVIAARCLFPALFFSFICLALMPKIQSRPSTLRLMLILSLPLIALLIFFFSLTVKGAYLGHRMAFYNLLLTVGLSTGVYCFFRERKRNPLLSLIGGIAAIVYAAMSVGSDFFSSHFAYFMHITLVCTLGLLVKYFNEFYVRFTKDYLPADSPWSTGTSSHRLRILLNTAMFTLIAFSIAQLAVITPLRGPFKETPYPTLTERMERHDVLYGIKTSPQKADMIRQLIKISEPGKGLAILPFRHFPMALPVLGGEPFGRSYWPDVGGVSPKKVTDDLAAAEKTGRLPLIVMGTKLYDDEWDLSWQRPNLLKPIVEFMERNKYVWLGKHKYFMVFIPPSHAPAGLPAWTNESTGYFTESDFDNSVTTPEDKAEKMQQYLSGFDNSTSGSSAADAQTNSNAPEELEQSSGN